MKFNGSFGNWLKQRRKALDLTQQDVADQVGYSIMTIRKIEGGVGRPSKQMAERLAEVLGISADEWAAFVTFARRMGDNPPSLPIDLTDLTPAPNLPLQSTPFVGRERELAQIADRLADPTCRMLTLVGPGGIGKTRLALQAAIAQIDKFADGVYFVSLAPVGTIGLIASAVASALQISLLGQEDPNVQVINYIRGKQMLLILDNFEHLLEGIELLTTLLANAPRLKILVTSRERLNMQEEWVFPVEGLPFPAPETDAVIDSYSAVQLFVQSARRVQASFLPEGNQGAIIDICQAVEGMPLGIELAATWLRAMPCHQIAGQIRRNLDFLSTPLRNVPERHRSLRAVFEHSWALLSVVEQSVLMRLSVFRGGFDPEAAEQIAGASLLVLAGLADKSLVRLDMSGRYDMHELLRQFAAGKLLDSNTLTETQRQHFEFYVYLAEKLEHDLSGPQHVLSLDRFEAEHDNFRAALDWISGVGDAEAGLRLAGALGWFWNFRAYCNEGLQWLGKFLSAGPDVSISVRAKAVHHALELSVLLTDHKQVAIFCEEGSVLARQVEDQRLRAWLLGTVGHAGDPASEDCQTHIVDALMLFRELGDHWSTCITLSRLVGIYIKRGDFAQARTVLDEGFRLARRNRDESVLCWLLFGAGGLNYAQGIIDRRTESLFYECLALFHALRHKSGVARAIAYLGRIAHSRGDHEQARTLFFRSLMLNQQIGIKALNEWNLIWLAQIFCATGKPGRAARLLGAVEESVQTIFDGPAYGGNDIRLEYNRGMAAVRAQLDEAEFIAAFTEGQIMSLDQAVDYVLDNSPYLETEQRSAEWASTRSAREEIETNTTL